jgi:hypothetical protein
MTNQQPGVAGYRPTAVVRMMFGDDDQGNRWAFVFDSVLKEDVRMPSKVTSDPVAGGAPISDHMFDEQTKVSLTVVVSNVYPFDLLAGKSVAQHAEAGDVLVPSDSSRGDHFIEEGRTRSQVALSRLDAIRRAHTLCALTTGLMSFPNMALTDIHYTTDEASAEVLQADLEFTQLRITRLLVTKYPPRKDRAKKSASKTKNKKEQPKGPTVAEQRRAYYQRLVSGADGVSFDPTTAKAVSINRYPLEQGETF